MFKSIRGRIILIYLVSLVFVFAVTCLYWWSIASVRNRLFLSEQFGDLLNYILEVRRFEKNFLLYGDMESLQESLAYLDKSDHLIRRLAGDIPRIVGPPRFLAFINTFTEYKELTSGYLRLGNPPQGPEAEAVRERGKELVSFAKELLALKRNRIHAALRKTYTLPILFFLIFFVALSTVVRFISARLLEPLKVIHQTTERVGRGDFRPISYQSESDDEISRLINAFNRMAQELEKNQEALIRSAKIAALGTFTAGIAHELNNPLNNIYLTGEMLLETHGQNLDAEGKELLMDILTQADRAADIVKSLLDFSRTDLPAFEELDLEEVIRQTVKLVKNQLMLTGTTAEIKVEGQIPPVRGNKRNLEQVFLNLLLNAIQAMPDGGEITITVHDSATDMVQIDISDTGQGMRPEDLQHIFEPFYTTKSVGRGTGLGLSVSYALIKKHGGYIEVQSELGVGTTFSVFLPKASEEVHEHEPDTTMAGGGG